MLEQLEDTTGVNVDVCETTLASLGIDSRAGKTPKGSAWNAKHNLC